MLREDKTYTELEAHVLDVCLVLHADHGGGNNATFTNHVVTSTGTDTYSAMAASLSSLKGPRHGGANLKVMDMMTTSRAMSKTGTTTSPINEYLRKHTGGRGLSTGSGLIYGLGHAVYTLSRIPESRGAPQLRRGSLRRKGQGRGDEALPQRRAHFGKAIWLMRSAEQDGKPLATNMDFYSGFVYDMLNIPQASCTRRCLPWRASPAGARTGWKS
jgi:citrate synthase